MRPFWSLLLIFTSVLVYLLVNYGRAEHRKQIEGTAIVDEIKRLTPSCWGPTRMLFFSLGCPGLREEDRTELAIILTTCICEAKGLHGLVCERSKMSFCHSNRNCLHECGMKYGAQVSEPASAMGYNVFERMYETVPFICKYVLKTDAVRIGSVDLDIFGEILFSKKAHHGLGYIHNLGHGQDYVVPELPNLRHLFFERISRMHDDNYFLRSFGDYIRAWASTPAFGHTVLICIFAFIFLSWLSSKQSVCL